MPTSGLSDIPQLPIDHPSSGLWRAHVATPEIRDYLRITRIATITVMSSATSIAQLCRMVAQLNGPIKNGDEVPVELAIEYNPYHYKYRSSDPTLTGMRLAEEHAFQNKKFHEVYEAAKKRGLRVRYVLFASELFWCDPTKPDWNLAILEKHRASYDIAMRYFPSARVIWYGNGSVAPWGNPAPVQTSYHNWKTYLRTTGLEPGADVLNPSLYYGADLGENRQRLQRTAEFGQMTHRPRVVPCLSLGSGWRLRNGRYAWDYTWDYDRAVSCEMGRLINWGRPVPWNVEAVWLYPQAQRNEITWAHFVAYCQGAAGMKLGE